MEPEAFRLARDRAPKIQIVSPMWPSPESQHTGVFVRNTCDQLRALGFEVDHRAVIRGHSKAVKQKIGAHTSLGLMITASMLSGADCIYVHAPSWFGPLAGFTGRAGNKKLVVHMHGGELFPGSRMERLSRPGIAWLARAADLVIVPSRYYADQIAQKFSVPARRVFVSPSGGVDTATFRPMERRAARRAIGVAEGAEVIGYVGRIDSGKGWDTFLDTLAMLSERREKLIGLVIGDGRELDAFEHRVRMLRLENRLVRFGVMAQPDLLQIYASMDALLFPSRRDAEVLGLVAIEALAVGVPVVGSRMAAIPEYVVDGETGFLCEPGSVLEFALRASHILDASPDERARRSRTCVEMARRYDARMVARQLANEMLRVIEAVD